MSEKPLQPGARFGPFLLVREIAHGGMGYVFEARDTSLDRRVAIKIISDELRKNEDFVKRFVREAKTLGRVSHANVVSVHSMGEVEGVHYIAMDFVDGLNLRQFLETGEFFLGDLCAILRSVTSGLAAIHAVGIVHRDIKLSNILVNRDREAKIGDFGLAKVAGDIASDITDTGQLIGTVQYMAPELLVNEPYSEASDIYSLGLLFFEALMGFNPLLAETSVETIERIRGQQLAFPTEVEPLISPELRALVLGMTAKKPFARPSSVREVLALLDQAVAAMPSAAARWPAGFAVRNMPKVIDRLIDKGRSSPVEVSLVLAKAQEKTGATGQVELDDAALEHGLTAISARAFSLPDNLSADDVPNIDIPKEKKPAKPKAKWQPRPEENVELDAQILETEKRKDAIAEAKHSAPKRAPVPVKLEATAPLPPRDEPAKEFRNMKPLPRARVRIFTVPRVFLAALLAAGAYVWLFASVSDAIVAGAPECKQSAEGIAVPVPYKDLGFPGSFSPFRELGLVCDGKMNCWARSRPWVTFAAARDHLFPKTPWGDAYESGGMLIFYDQARHVLRVRNTEAGQKSRLTLGLEECVFSARPEKTPMLRYYLATLAGDQLEALFGGSAPEAAPPAPASGNATAAQPAPPGGKKDEAWNQKGWNRFIDFINKGK